VPFEFGCGKYFTPLIDILPKLETITLSFWLFLEILLVHSLQLLASRLLLVEMVVQRIETHSLYEFYFFFLQHLVIVAEPQFKCLAASEALNI